MNLLRFRPHNSWSELASAYADGSIEPARVADFEQHQAACQRCREAVRDAGALRIALRALPDEELPRSFRVTPAMLIEDAPVPRRSPRRAASGLAWGAKATAGLAAAALAVVLVIDVGSRAGEGDNDMQASSGDAGGAVPLMETLESEAEGADAARDSAIASPEATGTAAAAPAYDSGYVEGSSAGEGEETPMLIEGDLEQAPAAPADEADSSTEDSVQAPDPQAQALAVEQQSSSESGSNGLRWAEAALAAALALAAGSAVWLSRRVRKA